MSTTTRSLMVGVAIVAGSMCGGWLAQQTGAVTAAAPVPAGYVALNPGRIYDSRGPAFTNARLSAGQQLTINTGQAGASAVGVNIVMTDTVGAGFLTAWPSGPRPNTSVMNSTFAGENIANFLLIPVAADGTFQLFTLNPTHVVVDIMGYMAGGSPVTSAGLFGQITFYEPATSTTLVSGNVTNGTSATASIGADILCPNGSVVTITSFDVLAGASRSWSVTCNGAFTSGATVTVRKV